LLNERDIAEFAPGSLLRAFRGFAAVDALACRHLQMALDFFTQLLLPIPANPQREFHLGPPSHLGLRLAKFPYS
jgi:hypothetical protein